MRGSSPRMTIEDNDGWYYPKSLQLFAIMPELISFWDVA
jgi:hypothetical protein